MADLPSAPCSLADIWNLNHRLNLRLLDALTDEQLGAVILPRGKAVTSYFAHLHMARFYWLERRARTLAKDLKRWEPDAAAFTPPSGGENNRDWRGNPLLRGAD